MTQLPMRSFLEVYVAFLTSREVPTAIERQHGKETNPPITIIAMFGIRSIDHSTAGSMMHEAAKTRPSPQLSLARAIDAAMRGLKSCTGSM
jgi:hypothetical protein